MAFDPNMPYDAKKQGVRRGATQALMMAKGGQGAADWAQKKQDEFGAMRPGQQAGAAATGLGMFGPGMAMSGLRRLAAAGAAAFKARPVLSTTAAAGATAAAAGGGAKAIDMAEQNQEQATAAKTQAERIAANNAQGDIDHGNEMKARQEFQRANGLRQNPTQFPGGVKATTVDGIYEGKGASGERAFSNDVNDPIIRGGNPGRGGFVGNPKDDPNAKPRTPEDVVAGYQQASQIYQGMSDRATGLRRGGGMSTRDQLAAQRNELMGLRLQQEARFKEAELDLQGERIDATGDRDTEKRIMELRQDPAARKDAISQLIIAGREIAASGDSDLTGSERGRAIRKQLGLLMKNEDPERQWLRDENDSGFNERVAGGDFTDLSVGDIEPWFAKKRRGIRVGNDGGQYDYLGGFADEDLDFLAGLSDQDRTRARSK